MSDDPNTELLDFLREPFARLHARLDRIDTRQDEIITLAGLKRRLDRVERRLDLAEAPAP